MYDADVIEAINFEQLATITDRLLLRYGQRPSRLPPAREPAIDRFGVPSLVARSRHPRPARIASTLRGYGVTGPRFARGSQPQLPGDDAAAHTLMIRPRPTAAARARWVAVTVVIPALIGAIAGLLMLM